MNIYSETFYNYEVNEERGSIQLRKTVFHVTERFEQTLSLSLSLSLSLWFPLPYSINFSSLSLVTISKFIFNFLQNRSTEHLKKIEHRSEDINNIRSHLYCVFWFRASFFPNSFGHWPLFCVDMKLYYGKILEAHVLFFFCFILNIFLGIFSSLFVFVFVLWCFLFPCKVLIIYLWNV